MKLTISKSIKLGGKQYRTGDAAEVARRYARVLLATGHGVPYVEKAARAAKPTTQPVSAPKPIPAVESIPTVHEEVARHHEDHHEAGHHEAAPKTVEASVKAAPKAAPAKSAGSKVDK